MADGPGRERIYTRVGTKTTTTTSSGGTTPPASSPKPYVRVSSILGGGLGSGSRRKPLFAFLDDELNGKPLLPGQPVPEDKNVRAARQRQAGIKDAIRGVSLFGFPGVMK